MTNKLASQWKPMPMDQWYENQNLYGSQVQVAYAFKDTRNLLQTPNTNTLGTALKPPKKSYLSNAPKIGEILAKFFPNAEHPTFDGHCLEFTVARVRHTLLFTTRSPGSCCGGLELSGYYSPEDYPPVFMDALWDAWMEYLAIYVPVFVYTNKWIDYGGVKGVTTPNKPWYDLFHRKGTVLKSWRNPVHEYSIIDLICIIPPMADKAYIDDVSETVRTK